MAPAVRNRLLIGLVVALAAALRLAAAAVPSMAHPDELFQYLEQAHRLVFGYGVIPWEYRYGMRSWLVPLALSPLVRLGSMLGPGGTLYLLLPKFAAALLSLLVLPAAYSLGNRLSKRHAMVALTVAAFWYEFIFFGAHVLTESLAVSLILPAAALLMRDKAPPRAMLLSGLLLGFATILRFHYAPALAVLVLLSCKTDPRRWSFVLGGGLVALAVSACVDLAMGQTPFGWIVVNISQNILHDRSAAFGISGPLEYFRLYVLTWGLWIVPLLLFMAPVVTRYRPVFWMAVANLAVHSAIGHKEYRFVLLSTAVFVILASIGSAEWLSRIEQKRTTVARYAPAALILLWISASAALASSSRMQPRWTAFDAPFRVAADLGKQPKLCGVAILGFPYWQAGGYAVLHRAVPIYLPEPGDAPRSMTAYDGIIAPAGVSVPQNFSEIECRSNTSGGVHNDRWHGPRIVCSYRRTGSCDQHAAPHLRLDQVLLETDQ